MKKKLLSFGILFLLVLMMTGCKKQTLTPEGNISPTGQPIVTLPGEVTPQGNPTKAATEDNTDTALSIRDYYPFQADTEYVYEGEGNEYAAYRKFNDYIDKEKNRIQTRTNNGGTETVEVLEIKDGKLSVVTTINECYYRDNLMDNATSGEGGEILLMEPLKQGTEWVLSDGRKRYISNIALQIETSAGSYKTIEVTTEGSDAVIKDYYALGVGLVKSIYQSEDGTMEVSSSLSEINSKAPFTQVIDVFYPDADEKIYVEPVTLTFHTNDITRQIMEETLQRESEKDTYLALTSENTIVNSLYLGKDNIVYVDFSGDFVKDMNAGAGYELLILQSVANTLGNYYQAQEVCITLNGKPYESGHILMKKGETLKVTMENVVR